MEPNNRRRIVRALEVCVGSGRPFSSLRPRPRRLPARRRSGSIGLWPSRDDAGRRASQQRFAAHARRRVRRRGRSACARPTVSRTARQALGYRQLFEHVESGRPLDECVDDAVTATVRFARRQRAWFRRDPRIAWFAPEVDLATARPSARLVTCVRLTKHEGWGNDFLVLVDPQNATPATPELARRVCDRRFGIGADGLLHLSKRDVRADLDDDAAQRRRVAGGDERQRPALPRPGGGARRLGERDGERSPCRPPRAYRARARRRRPTTRRRTSSASTWARSLIEGTDDDDMLLNVGNPHRVRRVADPDAYDLVAARLAASRRQPRGHRGGSARSTVKMRVHERGAGETLACGTGACAVAVAASQVGPRHGNVVTVRQPGGDAVGRHHRYRPRPTRWTRHLHRQHRDSMTLIDRSFREKIVLVGVAFGRANPDRGRGVPRRAGAAGRHRRRRRRSARPATARRARPGDLHRQGQGRGVARAVRDRSTPTPSCSTTS